MSTLAVKTDERVETVYFNRDSIVVDLMDGRTISAPLTWFPKLLNATFQQRNHWKIAGGGYGIHWPDIDEDLSVSGLLRGAPAPNVSKLKMQKKRSRQAVRRSIKKPRATTRKRKIRV